MNRIGGKSNSGEGGEDEDRFYKNATGDWKNSAIKQVASVGSHDFNHLTNAKEIQELRWHKGQNLGKVVSFQALK